MFERRFHVEVSHVTFDARLHDSTNRSSKTTLPTHASLIEAHLLNFAESDSEVLNDAGLTRTPPPSPSLPSFAYFGTICMPMGLARLVEMLSRDHRSYQYRGLPLPSAARRVVMDMEVADPRLTGVIVLWPTSSLHRRKSE